MAITIFHSHVGHAAFKSSLVCPTFDPMILGRLRFPGTKCLRWYTVRLPGLTNGTRAESLGTAALHLPRQAIPATHKEKR